MTTDTATAELLARKEGALGHITLNRPQALNALTLDMIRAIDAALTEWETDDEVRVILLDGAGERGFCAGGDIKAIYASAQGDASFARGYFREEYALDHRIATYAKPVVTLMDGLVMGGGVGLTAHAAHRVATDRLKLAMPEVSIGFTPDVGATYLLADAPGEVGTHLALTGATIGAADAEYVEFADHVISAEEIEDLVEGLRLGNVGAAIISATVNEPGVVGLLEAQRDWIDACYRQDTVENILAALDARTEPAAHEAAATLRTKSPTSLKVTLRALREARELHVLAASFALEFRMAWRFLENPDFAEGVRAAVVDKDRNPQWQPATLDAVTDEVVDAYFVSLGIGELDLTGAAR
ncbi:MAG: 3-hydroxyisobutyryl-CoA hydrolase [Thermoleophilia bacterium]|nr:3-hydroxyisobutyryl-CoA hydrolase [Thermoleophilia bacterium]